MSRGPIPDLPADRPTVPDVLPRLNAYLRKPGNSVGGRLNSFFDGNQRNAHLRMDAGDALYRDDPEACDLACVMLAMTRTQRRKLACSVTWP